MSVPDTVTAEVSGLEKKLHLNESGGNTAYMNTIW